MKKTIEELSDGIYIIKNYISPDTAKILTDVFNKNLVETDREQIYGGPSQTRSSHTDLVGDYINDSNYNLAIDIFNLLLFSINDLISIQFKEQHIIKSSFYSAMKPGAFNGLHMDNYYLDEEDNSIKIKKKYAYDKSGLLYLNEDYTGGYLHFPNQKLKIKPETGSLIFFEGDQNKPHQVTKVESGIRNNLVCFFDPSQLNTNDAIIR